MAIHASESLKQAVSGCQFRKHAVEADIQGDLDDLGRNYESLLLDVFFLLPLCALAKRESGVNEQRLGGPPRPRTCLLPSRLYCRRRQSSSRQEPMHALLR